MSVILLQIAKNIEEMVKENLSESKIMDYLYLEKTNILTELNSIKNKNEKFNSTNIIYRKTPMTEKEISTKIKKIIRGSKSDYDIINVLVLKFIFQIIKKSITPLLSIPDTHAKTFIINNPIHLQYFHIWNLLYYWDTLLFQSPATLGLDFEFNSKKIALIQINYASLVEQENDVIFIIAPQVYNSPELHFDFSFFINHILIPNYKILHGSDSLDIPYLFYELLSNDPYTITTNTQIDEKRIDRKKVIDFSINLVDTRYLCEYYYLSRHIDDEKCKIYKALLYFKVISPAQYKFLLENEEEMGPIYNININIKDLSLPLIKYSAYDVVFLPSLVDNIRDKVSTLEFQLITQMTQLVFLEKREITHWGKNIKSHVDTINNFMIPQLSPLGNKMIDQFKIWWDKFARLKKPFPFHYLFQINYFKNTLTLIIKFLLYSRLTKKFTIMATKHDKYNNQILNISRSSFQDQFKSLSFHQIKEMISFMDKTIQKYYI